MGKGAVSQWMARVAAEGEEGLRARPHLGAAPELKPDEGVWRHLKHVELRNLCCRDLDHLSAELSLAVKRLREKPSTIQLFFAGAGLDIWGVSYQCIAL